MGGEFKLCLVCSRCVPWQSTRDKCLTEEPWFSVISLAYWIIKTRFMVTLHFDQILLTSLLLNLQILNVLHKANPQVLKSEIKRNIEDLLSSPENQLTLALEKGEMAKKREILFLVKLINVCIIQKCPNHPLSKHFQKTPTNKYT